MKKITLFKMLMVATMMFFGTFSVSAQLLVENFNYTIGSALKDNGWTAHSGSGSNSPAVSISSITYPGYASSGVGNETSLTTSGEDLHRTFTAQTSGTIYAAVLVNVSSANTTGDYFFHVGATTISTNFRGRVFVKKDASDNIQFGISQSTTTVNYSSTNYSMNTTYLLVLRYEIVSGTTNDVASIYINPPLNAAIPTSGWISNTDAAGTDLANIGSVALRQGSTTPNIKIDGIRISTLWSDIVGEIGPACTTSTLAFATSPIAKLTSDAPFTITPTTNSTGTITYSSSATGVATVNSTTGEVTLVGAGSTVITANQAADATYCANTATYTLNVTSAVPTITVTEVTIPQMSCTLGNTDSEIINVSGANLTGNITLTIDGADAAMFSVTSPLPSTGGLATITYTPSAIGTHTATLRLNSNGAAEVTKNLTGTVVVPTVSGAVIITEVYGGGGNSGATLKNDFIELYNTTTETVEIGGWSVQYYSSTGTGTATAANIFVLPAGKYIPSGSHFLIQAAAGSSGTVDLTYPDAKCDIAMGATGGKIILYRTSAAQDINSSDINSIINNPAFVDYLPYGTTAVPVWGSAMAATSNTTSAHRKITPQPPAPPARVSTNLIPYLYTGNIGNDFTTGSPTPVSTGITSAINPVFTTLAVNASNGKVMFNATAGERIEIFNAVGQRIVNTLATDGSNSIAIESSGVLIVKVGDRIAKVIL